MANTPRLWSLSFLLCTQLAFAGTEVGYDLNPAASETTPAIKVVDNEIKLEDRAWAVPGVEKFVGKHSSFGRDWISPKFQQAAPKLPEWISNDAWPLTRDLWSHEHVQPYLPMQVPGLEKIHRTRRGFDGIFLATPR